MGEKAFAGDAGEERKIDVLIAGPSDGLPLVLNEGTPVGLVLYPPTVQAASIRGLRVIMAARPGYEGSTPRPGRRCRDRIFLNNRLAT